MRPRLISRGSLGFGEEIERVAELQGGRGGLAAEAGGAALRELCKYPLLQGGRGGLAAEAYT